ncbi:MAG: RsmE family RNA methyltransferase [Chitinophagaceae bacterium]
MAELPIFFEESLSPANPLWQLSDATAKHCIQVLRMRKGDKLMATNGKGLQALAILQEVTKKEAYACMVESTQMPAKTTLRCIAISPLKNSHRMEWFVEKATEMGIEQIQLLQCSRTEKQQVRLDRLQQIAISAMLQSKQFYLPEILPVIAFQNFIQSAQFSHQLIAHCNDGEKKPLNSYSNLNNACLLIGPEGDFTPQEVNMATEHKFVAVSLGNTRLRTETAGIVGATLLVNS